MCYWKHITGKWFLWSYGEEGFTYWKEPKLIRVFIDAWNGWFLYSPIVIIPVLGLLARRKANKYWERNHLFILFLATYIFASWHTWWFGGAFGHRSYVEFYALLSIPFAAVTEKAFARKWTGFLYAALCVVLCYYSIGMTYLYHPPWDGKDWTYEDVWEQVQKLF